MGVIAKFEGELKKLPLTICYLRIDTITGGKRKGWRAVVGVYDCEADAQWRGEDALLASFNIHTSYVEGRSAYELLYERLEEQVAADEKFVKNSLFGGDEPTPEPLHYENQPQHDDESVRRPSDGSDGGAGDGAEAGAESTGGGTEP